MHAILVLSHSSSVLAIGVAFSLATRTEEGYEANNLSLSGSFTLRSESGHHSFAIHPVVTGGGVAILDSGETAFYRMLHELLDEKDLDGCTQWRTALCTTEEHMNQYKVATSAIDVVLAGHDFKVGDVLFCRHPYASIINGAQVSLRMHVSHLSQLPDSIAHQQSVNHILARDKIVTNLKKSLHDSYMYGSGVVPVESFDAVPLACEIVAGLYFPFYANLFHAGGEVSCGIVQIVSKNHDDTWCAVLFADAVLLQANLPLELRRYSWWEYILSTTSTTHRLVDVITTLLTVRLLLCSVSLR